MSKLNDVCDSHTERHAGNHPNNEFFIDLQSNILHVQTKLFNEIFQFNIKIKFNVEYWMLDVHQQTLQSSKVDVDFIHMVRLRRWQSHPNHIYLHKMSNSCKLLIWMHSAHSRFKNIFLTKFKTRKSYFQWNFLPKMLMLTTTLACKNHRAFNISWQNGTVKWIWCRTLVLV